ncbi:MAG: hypothetical protein HQM16_13730 [Deltaproteobacteria bacterium]|nr:hypothetical protein [Deltaproteobacteria bacterium]
MPEITNEKGFFEDVFDTTYSWWSQKFQVTNLNLTRLSFPVMPGMHPRSVNFEIPGHEQSAQSAGEALNTAVEYWTPPVKTAMDYWTPRVQASLHTSWHYWEPRLEKTAAWVDDVVLGAIRKPVNYLRKNYGDKIAAQYLHFINFYEPKLERLAKWTEDENALMQKYWTPKIDLKKKIFASYWKNSTPNLYQFFSDSWQSLQTGVHLPVLLYDMYQTWTLENLSDLKKSIGEKNHAGPLDNNIDVMEYMMKYSTDNDLTARINRLFDDVLPHSCNPALRPYYKLSVLDSDIPNAFNTGTTI